MTPAQVADYLIGDEVPFDSAALAQLETKLGVQLPADLLGFLKLRNGGATSPTAIEKEPLSFRGGELIEHFYCLSGLSSDWNITSIRNYKLVTLRDWMIEASDEPPRVPAHWLVFGQNWGGDQWALDLSVDGGEVVYLDHELLPYDAEDRFPDDEGAKRLGVNFADFLSGLCVEPSVESPRNPSENFVTRFFARLFR